MHRLSRISAVCVRSRWPTRRASVEISVVTAAHESSVPRGLLTDPEKKNLDADNVSLTLGPSTGYVIRFTNGLTVYLSGDTGLHAEMKSVVGGLLQSEPHGSQPRPERGDIGGRRLRCQRCWCSLRR